MDNQRCIELLNRVLDGTVNSVVQYFAISGAYIPPGFDEHLETMERIRNEEVQQAHDLNEALYALDGAPKVGVFKYWNVDLNYLDARFMVRFAAEHQQKVVDELAEHLEGVRENRGVFRLLSSMLEQKRGHLAELRAIAPDEPEEEAAPDEAAETAEESAPEEAASSE